jgi:hypothetical protein
VATPFQKRSRLFFRNERRELGTTTLQKGGTKMPQDEIEFEIRWSPSIEDAALVALLDNGDDVLGPNNLLGTGSITKTYTVPRAVLHAIEWELVFPGKTLTNLEARARRLPGGAFQVLDQAATAKNAWSARGVLQ